MAFLIGASSPGLALPAQVLLLRHGHKNPSHTSYNLSEQGFERATALAHVIPACFGQPTHIITYPLDPDTGKNARSYQTAVPLAVVSGVNIRIDTAAGEPARLAQRILNDPAYTNGRVVLFWEHRRLPALAAALGWPTMPPIGEDDFDRLDQLVYQPGILKPLVQRWSQSGLLAGSQPCSGSNRLP